MLAELLQLGALLLSLYILSAMIVKLVSPGVKKDLNCPVCNKEGTDGAWCQKCADELADFLIPKAGGLFIAIVVIAVTLVIIR